MSQPARDLSQPSKTPSLMDLKTRRPAAFEELVRANAGRMLAVALRYLGDEQEARDTVQEAFLAAYRSIGQFAGDAQISTWLHRIVVNCALMRLRGRNRRPEESIEGLLPEFDETGHRVAPGPTWSEAPDRIMERKERADLVRTCIQRLPPTYRTVLLLRDIEQMDTEEAAKLLGITENATKIRLHRARQALRTLLDPYFQGPVTR